jgi:hypothetical protein
MIFALCVAGYWQFGEDVQRMGAVMDPQQIITACQASWDANKSNCSGFVKAVCSALQVTAFDADDNADSIVDKLRAGGGWTALGVGNGPAAKAQADAGVLVIAGLKGSEQVQPDANGHVVVVVTGPLDAAHGKYPTAYWGRLGGVGAENQGINFAWRAGDRDNVDYFAMALE